MTAGIMADARMWRTILMHIWMVTPLETAPWFICSIHVVPMVAEDLDEWVSR